MDLPLRWTSRTTCSASFGLFRFPIFDFIGLDVRLLTGLPPRRTYWAIRPAQYMLKLFLLQIPAVSTSGGCFTRCRPCSFFRLPIIFGPSHTSVIIVQRNQPVTFEWRTIRHRIPEQVVPRRTPRSRGQLKRALSTAYGKPSGQPEDSDFAFLMPPCLRHTPIPSCGGVLGSNSCMWGVSVVLVLVLCIPGPLGPGVLIAKTSFGHKMAETGGDPGGRWLPCRLVSHAASIHPLSR